MLTVLLATRNGAATLPRVLNAYRELVVPSGGWKAVIVDNGSTDRTREIILGFETVLPLTYGFEAAGGKNAALNSGLALVSGDLVVLTDDDTIPRPDWLVQLRRAADLHPGFDIFGGPVHARWEVHPPAWIGRGIPLAPTYAISPGDQEEGPIEGHHIFGPNMAVRAAVFGDGHRFDATIGPANSRRYAMGSETEFVLRIIDSGARAWCTTSAVVEHIIRPAQIRIRWVMGRAVRFGRGQCALRIRLPQQVRNVWGFRRPPDLSPRLFGWPVPLLYHLARKSAGLVLALARFKKARLMQSAWAFCYVYGYACEARDAMGTKSNP